MTITARNYYGGAAYHRYTAINEIYTMPAWTNLRVWILSDDDLAATTLHLRLPDVNTLRRLGWETFLIANGSANFVSIEHNDGTAFGPGLDIGQAMKLGLVAKSPASNVDSDWVYSIQPATVRLGTSISKTFNVGSDNGPTNNEAEAYSHETDVWSVLAPLPLGSGTPRESAASEVFVGTDTRGYFSERHLMYRFQLFSYTNVSSSSSTSELSGMSNEGSTIYRVALDSLSADRYSPGGDSWAVQSAPTGVPFNNSVSTDLGLRTWAPAVGNRVYIAAGTPDSAVKMTEWVPATQTYRTTPMPSQTFGTFAPTLVGEFIQLHMQCGGLSSTFTPEFSSNYHGVFNYATDSWATLPVTPVIGRGMGAAGLSSTFDRYTFGMGATAGYPATATGHYQYKVFTQVYSTKSSFAWGDRDRRENAWARIL